MPVKKKGKKSKEISSKDRKEIKEIQTIHKNAREFYKQKVGEIEQDYIKGELTYMQSVREVIKVNKAYNAVIRKLIKRVDNYVGV